MTKTEILKWGLRVAGVALIGLAFKKPKRKRSQLLADGDDAALIGDSLAVGIAQPLGMQLGEQGVSLESRGIGGSTAQVWVDSQQLKTALTAKPKATIIILGTNDCAANSSFCAKFEERMIEIGNDIQRAGSVPVFVAAPPMPWEKSAGGAKRMDDARRAMQIATAQASGVYVPPPPFEVARGDGIHPTTAGYAAWAAYLSQELTGEASEAPAEKPYRVGGVPSGWRPLTNAEVTPALRAKAVEVLHSDVPVGAMLPFTHEGQQYGALVTVHPGTERAVELWRPT